MPNSKSKNQLLWILLLGIFIGLVYVLRPILLPFALGGFIGYLFNPLVNYLNCRKIGRTTASCLVLLLIILLTIPTLLAIGYITDNQIKTFANILPHYIASFNAKITPLISSLQENFPNLSKDAIQEYLQNNLAQSAEFIIELLQKLISSSYVLFNIISLLLVTPIVAFYMLRDWNSFIHHTSELLPRSHKKDIQQQAKEIDKILSSFIRGQISVCFILGSFYAICLSIIGLDLGFLVGMLSGFISFIPYVGSITGFLLSLIIALAQFNTISPVIATACIFIIGQVLEGNFLTPKLVGDSVGLHPVWIMFALLAGGLLLGFLGLMIAIPLAAIIGVILRHAVAKYKQSAIYK